MTAPSGEIWDRRFRERPWPTAPDPYLVQLVDPLPLGRGLDLGAGPGRNSVWLAVKGWDMTLVDASGVGLAQAATAAVSLGATVRTLEADLFEWEPTQSDFDLVILANVHPEPAGLVSLLASAARALRPGGHLYVVGHHIDNLGRNGPPDPDRLLTTERLRAALPDGLDVAILEQRHREVPGEGDGGERRTGETVVLAWALKPTSREGTET